MERVHGRWEDEPAGRLPPQGSQSSVPNKNVTIVKRIAAGSDLRYTERLGPRALRFFRVRRQPHQPAIQVVGGT